MLDPVQTSNFSCTELILVWVDPNVTSSTVDSDVELNYSESIHFYHVPVKINCIFECVWFGT